jgi:hypothetical protein
MGENRTPLDEYLYGAAYFLLAYACLTNFGWRECLAMLLVAGAYFQWRDYRRQQRQERRYQRKLQYWQLRMEKFDKERGIPDSPKRQEFRREYAEACARGER